MPYCDKCGNELPPDAKFCPKCGAAVAPPVSAASPAETAQPKPIAQGLIQATWGERFVAWIIDVVMINIVLVLLSLAIYAGQPFAIVRNEGWWASVFNFNISGLVFFLYWLIMEGAYGQSLGKMIMHLKVTRLNGKPINMGEAALESVGKAFFLPIDFLVGWGLYPRRKQRIMNFVSGTIVIRE